MTFTSLFMEGPSMKDTANTKLHLNESQSIVLQNKL